MPTSGHGCRPVRRGIVGPIFLCTHERRETQCSPVLPFRKADQVLMLRGRPAHGGREGGKAEGGRRARLRSARPAVGLLGLPRSGVGGERGQAWSRAGASCLSARSGRRALQAPSFQPCFQPKLRTLSPYENLVPPRRRFYSPHPRAWKLEDRKGSPVNAGGAQAPPSLPGMKGIERRGDLAVPAVTCRNMSLPRRC